LAVDHRHARQGLGTALVAYALATAAELNERAACRAVVVTAINESSRQWWEGLGFERVESDDPEGLDLFLLTSDIEATLVY
jgi:ribosomal protein S18 acetylase RimI-like enzyme